MLNRVKDDIAHVKKLLNYYITFIAVYTVRSRLLSNKKLCEQNTGD